MSNRTPCAVRRAARFAAVAAAVASAPWLLGGCHLNDAPTTPDTGWPPDNPLAQWPDPVPGQPHSHVPRGVPPAMGD